MSETRTLTDKEAVNKIKELANDNICMFCTYEDFKLVSRPMATSGIDDDGTMWFFSKSGSEKNQQIRHNQTVDLLYMDAGKHHYLALTGYARVVQDKEKARKLWSRLNKAWFEDGLDDPELSLLKVIPAEGHYWDTRNGKLVSFIKIAIAALAGKEMDGSIEGDILP